MLRSPLLLAQPKRVPALCWEEWGQKERGLVGVHSSPRTKGEREREGKEMRAEGKVTSSQKAAGLWILVPRPREVIAEGWLKATALLRASKAAMKGRCGGTQVQVSVLQG